MRSALVALALLGLLDLFGGRGVAANSPVPQQLSPARVVQSVRANLGEPDSAVKTIRLQAAVKSILNESWGSQAPTIESDVELAIAVPDHFVRRETEKSGKGYIVWTYGFAGRVLLDNVKSVATENRASMNVEPSVAFDERKSELARWMSALLFKATASVPLSFEFEGKVNSAQGSTYAFNVLAANGFKERLLIDAEAFVPRVLSYTRPHRPVPASERSTTHRVVEPDTDVVEWTFTEHRQAGGILVPSRIVQTINGQTRQEWLVKSIDVNLALPRGTFAK